MDPIRHTTGKVTGIISNLVTVEVDGPVSQNEICYISLGDARLMEFQGHMLEATLGPGLLSSNFDGLQNNLATMEGVFLKRGEYTAPIDVNREWNFTPLAAPGDEVRAADWLGEVKEGWLPHKIMVPFS